MNYSFFLITIPGLEELLLKEIELKCPTDKVVPIKGGIEILETLDWVYQAHYLLKIPTRIIMRLEKFKVKDFPKFYQKILKINWHEFLFHPNPTLHITCHESRLFHTGKIEETFQSALASYFKSQPLKETWKKENLSSQNLYLRFYQDELTISLDLSGETLHKRSYHNIKGEAPLRETIAAALVLEANLQNKYHVFLDYMCGSGTLLSEARDFFRANICRKFDFHFIPLFKKMGLRKINEISATHYHSIRGADLDKDLIEKISPHLSGIELEAKDFFEQTQAPSQSVLIMNPPYNVRIKTEKNLGEFLQKVKDKIINDIKPTSWGILVPSDVQDLFPQKIKNYQIINKRKFRNGGLSVVFVLYEDL